MNAKFTKGEWVVNSYQNHVEIIGHETNPYIADVLDSGIGESEAKSNAHLIAAAPDMYRLLEACEKTFAALYPSEVKHVQPEHYSEFKAVHHLIGSIQNSLSKARGE